MVPIHRLQSVLKAAAHLITGICHGDHITLVLRQLHRLPVHPRVMFSIAGLLHQSLAGATPAYLADECRFLSDAGHHPLRSSLNDMRKLLIPPTHNTLGDRSFTTSGPRLCSDLPPGLRRPRLSFDSFKRSLKSHLFGD